MGRIQLAKYQMNMYASGLNNKNINAKEKGGRTRKKKRKFDALYL
jgi:hypothetical protein